MGDDMEKLRLDEINYKKRDRSTEVALPLMDDDHEAWLRQWELKSGKCHVCQGSGKMWTGWNAESGHRYGPCNRCGESGNAPALEAAE